MSTFVRFVALVGKGFCLSFVATFTLGTYAHAATLKVDFKTKKFSIKAEFPHRVGNVVTIVGFDDANKPYHLEFFSEAGEKKGFAYVGYRIRRGGENQISGKVMTQIGNAGSMNSGAADKPADKRDISFEATIVE